MNADKENTDLGEKQRRATKKGVRAAKGLSSKKLKPLKLAAERIADILSELSGDTELFVISQEEKPTRKIDTKTLKEFSSVIKEITGVICELNGITSVSDSEGAGAIKIEFDEETETCSE